MCPSAGEDTPSEDEVLPSGTRIWAPGSEKGLSGGGVGPSGGCGVQWDRRRLARASSEISMTGQILKASARRAPSWCLHCERLPSSALLLQNKSARKYHQLCCCRK
jgi:hypothetical protein